MGRIKSKKFAGVYYNDLKNGDRSYFITYRDADKKLRMMNVGTKKGGITEVFAYNERLKIINQLKFGDDPNIKKRNKRKVKNVISFEMLAQKYFSNKELDVKASTLKEMKSKYNNHIKPYIGDMDIDLIEKKDIELIKKEKMADTAEDPKKVLAPKTINMVLDLITSIFKFAIDEKLYKGDNLGSKVKNLKIDNDRDRYLKIEEINKLLWSVRGDKSLYTFCILSLTTGARVSSVMNIRKRDVNFNGRKIKIKDMKNNSTYYGFIKENFYDYLNSEYNHMNIDDNSFLVDISGEDSKYRIKNIQRKLKPILDTLFNTGLDDNDLKNRVVTHTLRHTFASHLAIKNTPIRTIQKLMNHQELKHTLRYAKLQDDSGLEFLNSIAF